jgi:hypothetical protein
MSDLIDIDKTDLVYCSIDRDRWLAHIWGEPIDWADQSWLDDIAPGDWLMDTSDEIAAAITKRRGFKYVADSVQCTANWENDFDQEFQYSVIKPESAEDSLYARDLYLAVEPHKGGDPRGNYGSVRLYGPIDAPAERGFYDHQLGWHVADLNGETLEAENDAGTVGWSANPTNALARYFVTRNGHDIVTRWSDKLGGFMARTLTGKTAILKPEVTGQYC